MVRVMTNLYLIWIHFSCVTGQQDQVRTHPLAMDKGKGKLGQSDVRHISKGMSSGEGSSHFTGMGQNTGTLALLTGI